MRMIRPPAASEGLSPPVSDGPARALPGLAAGFIVALPLAMWLANRSAPLVLALAALALVAAALAGGGLRPLLGRLRACLATPLGLALGVFLLWSLATTAWSHRPLAGLAMWGEFALPLLCGLVVAGSGLLRVDAALHRALALALVAAALLVMLELATGLAHRTMLGLGMGQDRTDVFNRSVLTALVLLPAALAGLWRKGSTRGDRALGLGAALAVAAAVLVSESGAAKLGLLIVIAVWVLSLLAPGLAWAAVTLGFVATMAAAPVVGEIVDRAMPAALHQRLDASHTRDRVDIWLSFGEAIRARPLAGSGFGATASLQDHPVAAAVTEPRRVMLGVGHPHSAPLQLWAETGLVGAALLGFTGLACLLRLRRLPVAELAPRLALFASAFGIASVAHGAWQGWWIAILATAATLLWLGRAGASPSS
jgi:O-antigen ligase